MYVLDLGVMSVGQFILTALSGLQGPKVNKQLIATVSIPSGNSVQDLSTREVMSQALRA